MHALYCVLLFWTGEHFRIFVIDRCMVNNLIIDYIKYGLNNRNK